ncbi:MAG: DMT family transporter [Bacteroidales bacterium]|nr:DMT family transporter [Bacteroidales bacterium]
MVFLLLSIVFSTATLLLFRFFHQWKVHNLQAITLNYLIASSMGFLFFGSLPHYDLLIQKTWLWLAMGMGILFIASFFLLALSSQKAGVSATAIASRMSVIIPVTSGFLLFGEKATFLKITGILLALPSFYFTLKNEKKYALSFLGFLFLIGAFLGVGSNDFLIKYADYHYLDNDLPLFLTVVFFVSMLSGLFILMVKWMQGQIIFHPRNIPAGLLLGLVNFGATYAIFQSVNSIESSTIFPVLNIGIVLLATLSELLFFGRKPGRENYLGFVLAIMAILFIAFG